MTKTANPNGKASHPKNKAGDDQTRALFNEADKQWDNGNYRQGFKLLKKAALMGDSSSMGNLGYAYDVGRGTKKNKKNAMFWYRKAARKGNICGYSNIGTIYRDENNYALARAWFLKALKKGDGDSALEIAKLYLKKNPKSKQAVKYLRVALKHKLICPSSIEEVGRLLKKLLS